MDVLTGTTVGRAEELEQLDAVLGALEAGQGGCLAVEGEPGIGKTRLLAELRDRADRRGFLVLSGVATEFEGDLPFGVLQDALDAYLAAQELELPDALRAELGAVFPSVRRAGGAAPGSVADERYRAHRAVRSLLERLAGPAPLVLVLDDLHWCDPASVELIAALLRRGPEAPVLFALGFRTGKAAERLAVALAVPSVRRIALAPLGEADAGALLAGLEHGVTSDLFRRSGGIPFYLEQLARADGNGGERQPWAFTGVPAGIAASLAAELASLAPAERALADAAAVAGEPFDLGVAAAVGGLAADVTLDALDGLLAADLLRSTTVPRRFAFRHPLVRQAVYESTPGGWRLRAHARASEALAAQGAAPVERAHHVEQAAIPGDTEAIALLLSAGAASATRAPETAARWYAAALRLTPHDDHEGQVAVRVALASALRSLGELERCRAVLVEAIDLTPEADHAARVELIALCAAVEHWLGRHDEAHFRLTRAWADLPSRTPAAAAVLQIELTVDGLYRLDFEQALARGAGALEAARVTGDRVLIAAAASVLCLAEATGGHIPSAREHREEALRELDAVTDAELGARLETLYHLGWAENYLEHYDEAIAHVDRGIAIARATGQGRLLVPMMLVKGYPLEMQGRLAEAVELCERAVEATRLSASTHELFWALYELGFAHYYTGDLEASIRASEESARVGGRLAGGTMPAAGGGPGWPLAMALFAAGDVARASALMASLGDDALRHKAPVERCFDWEILALVAIALGRIDVADGLAGRSEAHAATLGLHLPTGLAKRTRALVVLARGGAREAAELARASAVDLASAGASQQAVYSIGMAGQALAAAGDRAGAVQALREAERELDRSGSLRVRDELRRDLRRLGARAETRGRAAGPGSGVAALSAREREIALLVTDRMTNREIAGTLFLSDKTVESHLRSVFVKLGVSSRVEVARAVEREQHEQA